MKPPPSARLIRGNRLSKGLVDLWLMNEGAGNKVYDLNGLNLTGYGTVGVPVWSAGNQGAALSYVSANEQYHALNTKPPITNYPFSVVAWFNSDNVVAGQALFWFGKSSVGGNYQALYLSGGFINAGSRNNLASRKAISSTSYSANTWNMAAGVWTAQDLRDVYLNAAGKGSDANIVTYERDGLYTRTSIGMFRDSSPSVPMAGKIGLVMLYNRALSASEIAKLYREPFCMFERKARTALMMPSVGAPPVGNTGIMTANAGYWGPTF